MTCHSTAPDTPDSCSRQFQKGALKIETESDRNECKSLAVLTLGQRWKATSEHTATGRTDRYIIKNEEGMIINYRGK